MQKFGRWVAGRIESLTAPEDIGKLTAENAFGDDGVVGGNAPVFIGGIPLVMPLKALEKDQGNALLKYYAIFGEGKGVAWDLERTKYFRKGIHALMAEEWARANLVV
ncbi:hypothetical protein PAAG_04702 [Paracoccidioides lutzii Pb01]|uniref:Uncharacterized protein n=1 Tax=Paracoccidioides lutzii (strain ATCC MYA-826 / Pb01) TaxID=502779 RepID=C1H273_PARBA|nr:hypothetical protein PAAG_04702 [Paracoccidioides lutzii Pb01]EEH33653.2 hypothetical protein PAAG_04702 [Paracoccidioides lutzii Pb01]